MALNPIDLQTMYAQLNNVAKQAANQQGVQLAQSMHQVDVVRQNQEKAKKVQQSEDSSKSSNVNSNGHNKQDEKASSNSKKFEEKDAEQKESKNGNLKESYLGQHIDITR
ncbi:MAG: hypothetical protein IIT58_00265 [Treponema sp.]|nr:hypothetical protein [Treponema sp.]